MSADQKDYALQAKAELPEIPVPDFAYRPRRPAQYRPRIGLIGCGGITREHLQAYRSDGYEVAALCDVRREAAEERRAEFYSGAQVFTDHRQLLDRADIEVVDIALHPAPRVEAIRDALGAGKHVLSQKPFALDLETARGLVDLAGRQGCRLAVNQNGRWAPYVQFMLKAIAAGQIGAVQTVSMNLNWDHSWIAGTAFEKIPQVILFDFAVHWVDMCLCYFGRTRPVRVCAASTAAAGQSLAPPMLAQASLQFPAGLATLQFDALSRIAPRESQQITGSAGVLRATGDVVKAHDVTAFTAGGWYRPALEGQWFPDGFRGAMGELLCAIEEGREPTHSGRDNLLTLETLFALLQSADSGQAVALGE